MSISSHSRRRFLLLCAACAPTAALAGCGFKLRGPRPLAFSSIYISGDPNSPVFGRLRRQIEANGGTKIVDNPQEAEIQLLIVRLGRDREILSLSGDGHVREYELFQSITFKVIDQQQQEVLPPTTITARRDYSFKDEFVIAKEEEEELLYKDMEQDLMEQLYRRLAALKP